MKTKTISKKVVNILAGVFFFFPVNFL